MPSRDSIVPPSETFSAAARIRTPAEAEALYRRSVTDPHGFWLEAARRIIWRREPSVSFQGDFGAGRIGWFTDGILNVTESCLDRHVEAGQGARTAILFEPDDGRDVVRLTYADLLRDVSRFAAVLRTKGIGRGDRVCIYMSMVPELVVAVLACARIGAIHSVVFGGFSAASLRDRILDSTCRLVVTVDEGLRGGRTIPLKATTDEAVAETPCVESVIVLRRTGVPVPMTPDRDSWWHDEVSAPGLPDFLPAEPMGAEDPLFILYTSGSTGKPKGVLHTSAGYLVHTSLTHELVFDHRPEDIWFCTADVGWVTGHSYIVYGPLANGATSVIFEGVPTWPDAGRFWDIVDRHGVTLFYTAPTAIRALMRHGDGPVKSRNRRTLRLLGTVGEPINPEVWLWYHRVVGDGRCPVVDTWWQTETGGILIAPLPGAVAQKPGSATLPLPGVVPEIVSDEGKTLEGNGVSGNLCISAPWPGMMCTVYGDHQRFVDTYFRRFPGRYFTGDGCRRDDDGYYWITGRVDDVINVSGHRLGTAEVESALVSHPAVAEAAVVGMPHDIKGQGIYAFVTLKAGTPEHGDLIDELVRTVRGAIGAIASPDRIQLTPALPKTRSGKIMRRILRKIAAGDVSDLGDTTTLADPSVIDALLAGRRAAG